MGFSGMVLGGFQLGACDMNQGHFRKLCTENWDFWDWLSGKPKDKV